MSAFEIPLFIRGQVIEQNWVQFGGRGGSAPFSAPDPQQYVDQLPLDSPIALRDLQEVSFAEILDLLEELGQALNFETNRYVQQAYAAALEWKHAYSSLSFRGARSIRRVSRVCIITWGSDSLPASLRVQPPPSWPK